LNSFQVDESFLPFSVRGPASTPAIQDYANPDGEYLDTTKTWDAPKLPDKKLLKKMGIEVVDHAREEWLKKKNAKKE